MEVTGKARSVIRTQVPQVLKLVGLSAKADRYPRQLSGGEQQRVSVARAFVNRPLILLADEPTGNLDPATSVGIMRILDRINRTGTTVVMATHDHAIVDAMRRRVVQLERGRVVRDESRGVYETATAPARAAAPASSSPAPPVPAAVEDDPGASVSAEEPSEVPAAVADVSPSEPVVAVGEVTGELPIVTDSGADA
jgi:ABC-type glutathione transport system ATPase component